MGNPFVSLRKPDAMRTRDASPKLMTLPTACLLESTPGFANRTAIS